MPILPEKFLLEKLQDNKSESIKERTRKIQHFFTLIISHPFLKDSDEVVEFLTMNNEVNQPNNYLGLCAASEV